MPDAHPPIWFWQRIITPHMAALANAVGALGVDVTYVANEAMSASRASQGWSSPEMPNVQTFIARSSKEVDSAVSAAPADAIHLCQGLRGNGLVGKAQSALRRSGARQWAVMETVDDAGVRGAVKRAAYRSLLWRWNRHVEGILAIGWETPGWLVARGAPANRVFPFAYFLTEPEFDRDMVADRSTDSTVRFLFVGQLIGRKRVDQLIKGLAAVGKDDIHLTVIGDGPMRSQWQTLGAQLLPGRIDWVGKRPMAEIPRWMTEADCLVLPSRHDGWGAVVSEALMVGTPVICSDACGSASVVKASNVGGIFRRDDMQALTLKLREAVDAGCIAAADRQRVQRWATALGVRAGAEYVMRVLSADQSAVAITPPWERTA